MITFIIPGKIDKSKWIFYYAIKVLWSQLIILSQNISFIHPAGELHFMISIFYSKKEIILVVFYKKKRDVFPKLLGNNEFDHKTKKYKAHRVTRINLTREKKNKLCHPSLFPSIFLCVIRHFLGCQDNPGFFQVFKVQHLKNSM